jgi:opacity protein-like surface antigen
VSISMRRARARRAVPSRRVTSLASGCALLASAAVAHADPSKATPDIGYNYSEVETARIAGTAGALRASSNSLSALFINPANLAATRVYHLGAFAQIWPEASRQSYGAAAVDSVVSSTRIAGGVGATYNIQDTDGINRKWTDVRFALAYPIADEFFLGLGGRYTWLYQNGLGPLGTSLASSGLPGARIVRGFSVDAGATLRPNEHFAASIVGSNLTNPDTGFQPTSFGGGLALSFGDFGGEVDAVADFTTWDHTTARAMAGLEGLFADHLEVRLGYRYDAGADSHGIAAGLGYIEKDFDVDASFRRTVVGEAATAIVFGFSYHLDSSGLMTSSGTDAL